MENSGVRRKQDVDQYFARSVRWLAVGGVVALTLAWTTRSECRTWYIKVDGTGDAPTIQAGVDSAQAEDTVLVAAGTYEIGGIGLDKPAITLISESGALVTRIVAGPQSTRYAGIYCNHINSSGGTSVEINGFWIEGFTQWKYGPGSGILLYESDHVVVVNNVISNCGYAINGAGDCMSGPSYTHALIQNNTILGTIRVEPCDPLVVRVDFECVKNILWGPIKGYNLFRALRNDVQSFTGVPRPQDNFSLDPQFCGPTGGNYTLQSDSPCAPGNPPWEAKGLVGALPVGCGTTKSESRSWGVIKDRYRNN